MMTSFSRSALALVLVFPAFAACGDGDDPAAPELDATDIAAIEALADRAIFAGIPAVSVVIQAGAQTVRIARGVEDRTTGVPVTTDHRFRVGSVAKSMLASITLQLVDEGKLRLSDTIESQLPGMVAGNSHATVEQVLRLESGIFDHADDPRYLAPYLAGNLEYVYSPQQLLALSNDHPPVFAPGERFMYSNTNYVIVGLIIEKLTGLSLAEAVAQRITTPLGMTATTMPLVSAMPAPYTHGYLMGGGEPIDVTAVSASSTATRCPPAPTSTGSSGRWRRARSSTPRACPPCSPPTPPSRATTASASGPGPTTPAAPGSVTRAPPPASSPGPTRAATGAGR
jgi:CubicO group peptidase (beta-lactamase class C family)